MQVSKPVRVRRLAPPFTPTASTSACSPRTPRRSTCCCSTTATRARPSRVIALDPKQHRTYHYWHVFVPGIGPGQIYAYRAHGPFAPEQGFRFDGDKVLLDPYGLAVAVPDAYDRHAAARPGGNAATAMKSVVADPDALRLGGRSAAPALDDRDDHLRGARARDDPASELRRRRRRSAAPTRG